MIKQSKLVYIIGSIVIGIVSIIGIIVGMIFGGVLDGTVKSLVFTSGSLEVVYSGEDVVCADWKLESGELKKGHTAVATITGVQSGVGTTVNAFNVVIIDENGADVSGDYQITCNPGTITVSKRKLDVVASSAEKVYDGTPLVMHEYSILAGTLASNHVLEVGYEGEITNVGETENLISAVILNKNGEDVTANYELTCSSGLLKVTKRPITVSTNTVTGTYNGKDLVAPNDAYSLVNGELVEGQLLNVTFTATQKTVGSTENVADVKVVDSDGNDYTENYEIEKIFGTLEVTASHLEIESKGFSREYDGTPLTLNEHEITAGTDPTENGHTLIVNCTGEITFVGEVKNTFTVTVLDESGIDVTSNYEITKNEEAKLIVTKRVLKIITANVNETYNGTPHYNSDEYLFAEGYTLPLNHELKVLTRTEVTNVTTTPVENEVSFDVIYIDENSIENVVSKNFELDITCGTITVNPIIIKIKTNDGLKVYDGKALTKEDFEYLPDSGTILDSHELVVKYTGNQTDPGVSPNEATLSVRRKGGVAIDESSNYDLTGVEFGSLTVTKINIEIKTEGAEKEYDGTPLTRHQSVINVNYNDASMQYSNESDLAVDYEYVLANGHKLLINYDTSVIDAGAYQNAVTVKVVMYDDFGFEYDVTANYEIVTTFGSLNVGKKIIKVITSSKTETYNGKALTSYNGARIVDENDNELLAITSGSFVSGKLKGLNDVAEFSIIGSQLLAGASQNGYSLFVYRDGEDKLGNYTILEELGTLTLEQKIITVVVGSNEGDVEYVYDDTLKSYAYFEILNNELISEHKASVVDGSFTQVKEAGEHSNELKIVITDKETTLDVTDNYKINYVPGTITIKKRNISVSTFGTEEFKYDGLTHSHEEYDYDGVLVSGHDITPTFKTFVDVGAYTNEVTVKISKGDDDVTSNYNIDYSGCVGVVKIIPIELKIITPSYDAGVFNGREKEYYNGAKVIDATTGRVIVECLSSSEATGSIISGDKITFKVVGGYVDAGDHSNSYLLSVTRNGASVIDNYAVVNEDLGTIKISARALKVVTPSYSNWIYDGKSKSYVEGSKVYDVVTGELICSLTGGASVERGIISATNDEIEISTKTSIKNAGEVDNEINVRFIWGNQANYEFVNELGTLKVETAKILIKTGSDSWIYDGTEKSYNGDLDVLNANTNEKINNFTITGGGKVASGYIVQGEIITVEVIGIIVNAGIVDNAVKANVNGNSAPLNYEFLYDLGKLTVEQKGITVTTGSNAGVEDFVYDGEYKSYAKFEIPEGSLISGHKASVVEGAYLKVNTAGEHSNAVQIAITDIVSGDDVTSNYKINYVNGTLTIQKRKIYLSNSKWKQFSYDATPHKYEDYAYSGELVENHRLEPIYEEFTNVNTYANKVTAKIFNGDDDVTSNYEIDNSGCVGVVEITPIELVVFTPSYDLGVYDGISKEYYNGAYVKNHQNGEIIIECLTSNQASGSVIDGEEIIFTVKGGYVNAGEHSNAYAIKVIKNGEDITSNYKVVLEFLGHLTITPRSLKVTTPTFDEFVYDGTYKSGVEGATVEDVLTGEVICSLTDIDTVKRGVISATNDEIEISKKAEIKNAGEVDNEINLLFVSGKDSNYQIINNLGKLKVSPIKIKVVTGSKSWDYDGEEKFYYGDFEVLNATTNQILNGYTRTADGKTVSGYVLNGEIIQAEVVGVITNAGTVENKVTSSVNGNFAPTNYEFIYELGNLIVNPKKITVKSKGSLVVYNGKYNRKYELHDIVGLISGHYSNYTEDIFTQINDDYAFNYVGEYENLFDASKIEIVDGDGNDVSFNYQLDAVYGIVSISAKRFSVTTAEASKVYDGTPLNGWELNDDYGYGNGVLRVSDSLIDGHTIDINCTASITEPGEIKNIFEWFIYNGDEDVSFNYELNEDATVYGRLIVTSTNQPGGSNLDSSGDISNDGNDVSEKNAYLVTSPVTQNLYLKFQSYGDVNYDATANKTSWGNVPESNEQYYYGNNLAYDSLAGVNGSFIKIVKNGNGFPDAYPYFTNEHAKAYNENQAQFTFYPFDDYNALTPITFNSTAVNYAEFVKANYISISGLSVNAKNEIEKFITANGLIKLTSSYSYNDAIALIKRVSKLVRNHIVYDLENPNVGGDVVYNFFRLGSEGKGYCQHYATAGTALLRALGLPSRYVVGITGMVEANTQTWIKTPGHAWVEVFVDGVGWIPVEVTGGSGGGNGGGNGEENDGDIVYSITPNTYLVKGTDSTVVTINDYLNYVSKLKNEVVGDNFLKLCEEKGYSYEVEFALDGKTKVSKTGKHDIEITSFKLTDAYGNDVTSLYKINKHKGVLQIYVQELNITTESASWLYDGKEHSSADLDYTCVYVNNDGTVPVEYYKLHVVFNTVITSVNENTKNIPSEFRIEDENGEDITDKYKVNFYYGNLKILPITITLTSGSAGPGDNGIFDAHYQTAYDKYLSINGFDDGFDDWYFDEYLPLNPLKNENVTVSGSLAEAHVEQGYHFEFSNFTEISDWGYGYNDFDFKIVNADGDELGANELKNYTIAIKYGELSTDFYV